MSNYRTTFYPHHDDIWIDDGTHPAVYKGIPGAKIDDFLTHTNSRYDDVYSYFYEKIPESDTPIDWNDKYLVMDYLDYLHYYYKKEHDCVRSHHKGRCCYMCKYFVKNGKNKLFLGSCIRGLKDSEFPKRHVGNYHAKHGFETCENFEMREYFLKKKK